MFSSNDVVTILVFANSELSKSRTKATKRAKLREVISEGQNTWVVVRGESVLRSKTATIGGRTQAKAAAMRVRKYNGAKPAERPARTHDATQKDPSMKPNEVVVVDSTNHVSRGIKPTPVVSKPATTPFNADIKALRRRAREHIEQGAVTENYRADREAVLKLLNTALATEVVCMLRYRRHYFMASGKHAKAAADEFMAHSIEEQGHADELAARITQLNGAPNLNPEGMLSRSHSEYVEGSTLVEMIRENLVAERVAVESYTEMIRYIGDNDMTTRRMLEGILAKEEEHANDLVDLMLTHEER